MFETVRDLVVRKTFGGGIQGTLAEKGIDWLNDEVRAAVRHEPEMLERVNLRPGDTYTVIARPADTKAQRRLAERAEALRATEAKLSRTSARQRRAARKLARAQKKLDRSRVGSRRHLRAKAIEAERAKRFDRLMAPSKKLARTRSELTAVTTELERSRARSFSAARGRARRSETVDVHR